MFDRLSIELDFFNQTPQFSLNIDFSSQTICLTWNEVVSPPSSPRFPQLFVFGDSLSDPGNLFQLTRGQVPQSPPYFEGRFSNGPIWIDDFATQLGFEADTIVNFAVGGAKTGRDNIGNVQLGANVLPGLLNEIDSYEARTLALGQNPEALFVVWAGGNDFQDLATNSAAGASFVEIAVSNLTTAMTRLFQLGARNLVVPNAIDFGLSPLARANGLSELTTTLAGAFNQALHQAILSLEHTFNVDIAEVDLFGLSQRIAATPEEFGFSNVSDQLIQQSNPIDPAGFFWWDDVHPTTQAHGLIAQAIESSVLSTFPIETGCATGSGTRQLCWDGAFYPENFRFEPLLSVESRWFS